MVNNAESELARAALDRAKACAQHVQRDHEVSRTKAGPEDGPALKHERAHRAFVARTLARLGLDVELNALDADSRK